MRKFANSKYSPISRRNRRRRRIIFVSSIAAIFLFLLHNIQKLKKRDVSQSPPSKPVTRYLFSTPRSGGFNNQLITVYEAIRCAQLLKRTLVLPLIYENVRADTSSKGVGPYPFEDYFDLEALKKVVDVATPEQVLTTGDDCNNGTVYFATSTHFYAHEKRIPRLYKQQYVKKYGLNPIFEPSLAKRNGKKLREEALCIDDSACSTDIFRELDEFGLYSDYAKDGQGYSIRDHPRLAGIRSAFQPSYTVRHIADNALAQFGTLFNSVHLTEKSERVCEPSTTTVRFNHPSRRGENTT